MVSLHAPLVSTLTTDHARDTSSIMNQLDEITRRPFRALREQRLLQKPITPSAWRMQGLSDFTYRDLSAACLLLGIRDLSVIDSQRIPGRPLAHGPANTLGEFCVRV